METDKLGNGVRTVENTLLHAGRIQLHDEIGKHGGEDSQVHEIQKERDESNRHDQTITLLESHPLKRQSRCEKGFVGVSTE